MESESPAQLPIIQETQAQPPSGQPFTYQMASGQQQPVFIQVPTGQPTTTREGQPIQYYYDPVGQPAQPGQPGQPVFVQGTPGQPAQSGQPVFIQGAPGRTVQPQQQARQGRFERNINTEFLKSPPCFIKIAEFVTLLGAWASILKYLDMGVEDERADFFKGIMIFSWVVVILYLLLYTLSVPKKCNCKRPSLFTITSVVFYFVLFALSLACTGNLVPRAVDLGKLSKGASRAFKDKFMPYIIALYVALAFGFLSCILFVVDMVLNHRLFQTQRSQEIPSVQGPPQRRVWDINLEYLSSPLSFVKLVEMAFLFVAWVCILIYYDLDIEKDEASASFFRGITIFSWVMVILVALTFIFNFDKICTRFSLWTLTSLLVYVFLFIMLIACCGKLIPLAIDFGKIYKTAGDQKPNYLALFIGLAFGFLSCILFVVDMVLTYRLFQTQRAQEIPSVQGPPQRRVWDINLEYLSSPLFFVKLAEMALLIGACVCIFVLDTEKDEASASFFKGITAFSSVMVILVALTFIFSFDKICTCSWFWTLTSLLVYFFLFIMLIACCGKLTPLAIDFGKIYKTAGDQKPKYLALFIGLAFGFLSCILFVVDMVLTYRLFQTQRAQEIPFDQGPPQRRVWDINLEYLRSPLFFVKLAEMAFLFVAWVCILIYFDLDIEKDEASASFFRGITIFSWAMVILVALTFIFSFDKICTRSLPWTLTTILVHFLLSILLIACCANLTPDAIDFAETYKAAMEKKSKYLALFIGLGYGYVAWVIVIVDIYLIYQQQQMQEFPPQQADDSVTQQPGVLFMPQNLAQSENQQVILPLTCSGQPSV